MQRYRLTGVSQRRKPTLAKYTGKARLKFAFVISAQYEAVEYQLASNTCQYFHSQHFQADHQLDNPVENDY